MKSIIQKGNIKECYLCRLETEQIGYYGELPHTGLHRHHFMHGTANRKKAEKYGLWAYMCAARHHEYGPESPHGNAEVDRRLKQTAQKIFEERYSHDLWMQEFGKNYLWEDENGTDREQNNKEPDTSGFIRLGHAVDNDL